MTWCYVEPCCGSASTALALLGATKPLLPYQGSKWRFRRGLLQTFRDLGFDQRPAGMALSDIGPWGIVANVVIDADARQGVIEQLQLLGRLDPRHVYDALHQQSVPTDRVCYAAQFLFLQRLAYSGKAVGDANGRWASPGFNTSSAFGVAGTERFGKVNPMIPSLIGVLEGYKSLATPTRTGGRRTGAVPANEAVKQPTLVYIDPPYAASTGYPAGHMTRDEVVSLALGWRDAGATVVISESQALPELLDLGWEGRLLDEGRQDTSRFRGKQQEWMTIGDANRR